MAEVGMEAEVVKMIMVRKVEITRAIHPEATGAIHLEVIEGVTVHLRTEGEMMTEDFHLVVAKVQGHTGNAMMKEDLLQDEMAHRHIGNGTMKDDLLQDEMALRPTANATPRVDLLQDVDAVAHQVMIEDPEVEVQQPQGGHPTGQPPCPAMAGDQEALLQMVVVQHKEEEVHHLKMAPALPVKAVMAESLIAGNFLKAQTKIF